MTRTFIWLSIAITAFAIPLATASDAEAFGRRGGSGGCHGGSGGSNGSFGSFGGRFRGRGGSWGSNGGYGSSGGSYSHHDNDCGCNGSEGGEVAAPDAPDNDGSQEHEARYHGERTNDSNEPTAAPEPIQREGSSVEAPAEQRNATTGDESSVSEQEVQRAPDRDSDTSKDDAKEVVKPQSAERHEDDQSQSSEKQE